MPIQAPDLNQDALNKLQVQEQFPQVQEKKVEEVKITKDTIQGQVALALEMMKAGKTPKIDVSKFPHYASNGATTPEQLKESVIAQIKEAIGQDISQLSPKVQDEFIAIYNEFQKNNSNLELGKDNPYWKGIFEAVKIKNEATGDLGELKKGYDAIQKAVSQAGIAHSPRGAEGKVYRYFKYKVELLPKVDDNLKQVILQGEREYISNGGKAYKFYYFVNRLTGNKIRVFITKKLKKFSPNFYQQLSNLLLTKKSNLAFSKEFYDIVIKERKVAEKERKVAEKERKVAEKERKVAEKERKVAEMKKNNDAGERILKKLGY